MLVVTTWAMKMTSGFGNLSLRVSSLLGLPAWQSTTCVLRKGDQLRVGIKSFHIIVRIHYWRTKPDRLPTSDNLLKKGIDPGSYLCAISMIILRPKIIYLLLARNCWKLGRPSRLGGEFCSIVATISKLYKAAM